MCNEAESKFEAAAVESLVYCSKVDERDVGKMICNK
jgi:hypothetical protein